MASPEAVLEALRVVQDPDLRKDIVTLGFVKNVEIRDGDVRFDIELTTPACPVRDRLRDEAVAAVQQIPGVEHVDVTMTSHVRGRPDSQQAAEALAKVKNVVAVASGKGGVGKSTVTVNLALALAREGARVGILDADVYGPSVPAMLGIHDVDMTPEKRTNAAGRILPVERFGVKVMSMAFLVTKDTPVIWRGPMASKLVQQFLGGVEWGELDYLLVDLPPGTGDVQLTLSQAAPLTGAVVVTTPQEVAITIAEKGLRMFQTVAVPILGIVENMSFHECSKCGHVSHVFRSGGGSRAAAALGVPLLGEIPLEERVAQAGDEGVPIVESVPDSPAARAYADAAKQVAAQVSIVNVETAQARVQPADIKPVSPTELSVKWSDGHEGAYEMRRLRAACPCATCLDEWTGRRKVGYDEVPADVRVRSAHAVGRYAVRFDWSDGHWTGIYTFETLRNLCQCRQCAGA